MGYNFANAPPFVDRTTPKRIFTTRLLPFFASCVACSHARDTSARNPFVEVMSIVSSTAGESSPINLSPYTPTPEAARNVLGLLDDANTFDIACVGVTREFIISAFFSSVHGRIPKNPNGPRPVATFSPDK